MIAFCFGHCIRIPSWWANLEVRWWQFKYKESNEPRLYGSIFQKIKNRGFGTKKMIDRKYGRDKIMKNYIPLSVLHPDWFDSEGNLV